MLNLFIVLGCISFEVLPIYLLIRNCANLDAGMNKREATLAAMCLLWFITSCLIIGNTLY